jgi:hypothetical protein
MLTAVRLTRGENPITRSSTGVENGRRLAGEWPVHIDGNWVHGQIVYVISESKTTEWPLNPGTHTLRVGGKWLGSPELSFTLDEGQVAAFKCRLRGGPFDAIACLFTHDRWIILEPSMTGDISDTM